MNKVIKSGTGNNFGFEDESLMDNSFALAFEQYEKTNPLNQIVLGETLTGTYIGQNDIFFIVDANNKSNIFIEKNTVESSVFESLEIGSNVDVCIINIIDNKKTYSILGSAYELQVKKMHNFLQNAYENKTVLTGIPIDFNHAGYNIQININDEEILLFMPHLLTDVNKLPDVNSIVDKEIQFILETVKKDNVITYIATRKAYLEIQSRKEIKSIKRGLMYTGYIINVTDFAIFVQFNDCLTGMIHKSNLTEQAKEMLENKSITLGTNIEFYVKDKDIVKNKLFLTQILRDSLWDTIKNGDSVTGKVVAIKDFGLLIELDYETKGLLHKSILPSNMTYKLGQQLEVKVTNVNKNNRQITLVLK